MIRLRIACDRDETAAIAAAVNVLRAGGVVAYPTDTLYGLAVDPNSDEALERLFAVKGRDRARAIPLIASSLEQARESGEFSAGDVRLAAAFWPGPLALVVRASPALSRAAVAADGTVAVRVPAHRLACALAGAFGGCITATSANLSGDPPTASPDTVEARMADRVDVLLDGGDAPGGPPSTIVELRGDGPALVRAGAIAWERVLKSLQCDP